MGYTFKNNTKARPPSYLFSMLIENDYNVHLCCVAKGLSQVPFSLSLDSQFHENLLLGQGNVIKCFYEEFSILTFLR